MSTKRIPPKKAKAVAPLPPATKIKAKTTPFTQIADRLDDTAILLHGLHRRHKNQHRVSTYWWPAFGQLRRAVSRLLDDVRKSEEKNGAKTIAARVGETRVLVPKVYLAFSRLVADKQFAPLGLLLVGVLAQVQAAVKDIEGLLGIADAEADANEDAGSKSKAGKDAVTSTSASTSVPKSSSSTKKTQDNQDVDVGVAISRDSRADNDKPKSSSSGKLKKRVRKDDSEEDVPELAASPAPAMEPKTTKSESKSHPEKKRKIIQDERMIKVGEGFVETVKRTPAVDDDLGEERKEKKAKKEIKEKKEKREKKEKKESKDKDKKKKRKRGDEFDDLFSGLM